MGKEETIELLKLEDEDALRFCSNYLSSAWNETLEEAKARLLKYARGENKEFCVIARINGSPVGMMACFPKTKLQTDGVYEPWSAGLYVSEDFRNQGIGERILGRLQQEARSRGYEKVHLATDLEHLKEWYTRLGWCPIGKAWNEGHKYDVFVISLA